MDAVLSGPGYEDNLAAILSEAARVLAPGGVHLAVSSCLPSVCQGYLENQRSWKVTVEKVHKAWVKGEARLQEPRDLAADFIYVCAKAGHTTAAPTSLAPASSGGQAAMAMAPSPALGFAKLALVALSVAAAVRKICYWKSWRSLKLGSGHRDA